MDCPFDQVVERRGTNCVKWDGVLEVFGSDELLPLWVADMDFRSPQAVVDAVVERAAHGVYGYEKRPDSFGETFVEWLKTRHNWQIDPSWLAHSPGVVTGLTTAVLAFTEPGERVAIQPPVYPPFYRILQLNGREVVENPLVEENGKYHMNLDELEEIFRSGVRTLLLCSPHNPVGRVWTREELTSLAELVVKYGVKVFSDEIWCDLVFKDQRHTPFASLAPEVAGQTLTFTAPSKTFNIAGLYVSNVIIPNAQLREGFNAQLERSAIGAINFFGLAAGEAAYREGGAWLDSLLDYLEENARFVTAELKRIAPQIRVFKPEGTFVLWLDCRSLPLPPEELNQFFAQEAGIGLNEGSAFGPMGLGFQRMNIGCPRSLLGEALRRIAEALAKL